MIGKAVAAISFKGGVGKSTLLACIALGLKRGGSFTVAVVDAAEDATATRLLAPRCAASAGALTYATGGGSAEVCTFEDGALVDVVPPGRILGDVRRDALTALLDRLRREYNFVLVDLPGAGFTHPLVKEAVEAADGYVVVLTPQSAPLVGDKVRPLLKKPYVVVLNKWVEGLPGRIEAEALGRSKWGPAWFIVEDEPVVEVAVAQGKLPCDITPRPKFAQATDRIAAFIAKVFYSV